MGGWEGEEEACQYSHTGGRERKRRVGTVTKVGGRERGLSVQSQGWEGEEEACRYSHKGGRERKRRVRTVTRSVHHARKGESAKPVACRATLGSECSAPLANVGRRAAPRTRRFREKFWGLEHNLIRWKCAQSKWRRFHCGSRETLWDW